MCLNRQIKVVGTFSINEDSVSNRCCYSREIVGDRNNNINNFKLKNRWSIKIAKTLEDSSLLVKGVSKAIKNEGKEPKGRFLDMLLVTLGFKFLGNVSRERSIKSYWGDS